MKDHKQELQIIMELMQELQDEMEMSESDFDERLGRKKPGVEVLKIEGELPLDEEHLDEMEMSEEPEELSPEEMLKRRIESMRKG